MLFNVLRYSRVRKYVPSPFHSKWFHTGVELMEDLETRGLAQNVTRPQSLKEHLKTEQVVYSGIDPTNSALHVGHLIPLMCLFHFYIRGHKVIPLIGGATAHVGDPSGRSTERPQLDPSVVESNTVKLSSAVSVFFNRAVQYAALRFPSSKNLLPPEVLDNYEWHGKLNLLDFLRTAGYHCRVNVMMARESVKARLDCEEGISFTEFTYQLLQAYDFYELNRKLNCTVQIGGSDQWGNILSGVDLISKLGKSGQTSRDRAFGITTPLLTTSSGSKISKSSGNAVWLDRSRTSSLDFYQFFLRAADSQVESWLKMFTLLSVEQIAELMTRHLASAAPHHRIAQKALADEVTEMIHGPAALKEAKSATKVLFESDYSSVDISDLLSAMEADPKMVYVDEAELLKNPLLKLGVAFQFFTSNSSARKLVESKGLRLNNILIEDHAYTIKREDLLGDRVAIVRAGPYRHLILVLKEQKKN